MAGSADEAHTHNHTLYYIGAFHTYIIAYTYVTYKMNRHSNTPVANREPLLDKIDREALQSFLHTNIVD